MGHRPRPLGRPRGFDFDEALNAATNVFWRAGYEATTLDDLLAEMDIGRSSFYATFGSKHEALKRALDRYTENNLAELREATDKVPDRAGKLAAAITLLADTGGGRRGCFFANCISEFAQQDPDVDAIVHRHLARLEAMFVPLLKPKPESRPAVDPVLRARLLLAQIFGIITLRKAGLPKADLDALQAQLLITVS